MLGWLWRTLIGRFRCDHKWEIIFQAEIYESGSDGKDLPIGHGYILQCKNCGTLDCIDTREQ